jgi:hypothetical protein
VTVTSTAYKGRDIEVAARLVDGQSLKFLLSADRELVAPEPGSSIEIVWQPMKPLLVPEAAMVEPGRDLRGTMTTRDGNDAQRLE